MAPNRVQKRKSTTSTAFTPPAERSLKQAQVPRNNAPSSSKTPARSPAKRPFGLTQSQKQALIDNLQLEITERARKLRTQYAHQAQALRTRLEIRVYRIPAALRKTTIGDLLEKYAQQTADVASTKNRVPSPVKTTQHSPLKLPKSPAKIQQPIAKQAQSAPRGVKRKSDDLEADKENSSNLNPVDDPSKRARTAPSADRPGVAPRNPSKRVVHPSQVLSPKSNNSRTLPQSPFRTGLASPIKSNIARPISPLKPSVAAPTATSLAKAADKPVTAASKTRQAPMNARTASRATTTAPQAATRAKRGAAAARAPPLRVVDADDADESRASGVSDATSQGTTIVRAGNGKKAPGGTMKKTGTVARAVNAANKKIAAHAAAVTGVGPGGNGTGTVKGGRTLRKRA